MGGLYDFDMTAELLELLDLNKEQAEIFSNMREAAPELWDAIQKKLKVRWITDSNAIEGSTLDFAETLFFLDEDLTVEGKPFKDFIDARNHADAIEYLMGIIGDERPVSTSLMKEVNALLLRGVKITPARSPQGMKVEKPATPGEYKKHSNHVVRPDGSIHSYVDPIHVASEMEGLIKWIKGEEGVRNPILIAAIAHYNFVRIHPFDDGNGRGARILMNLILMKAGLIPAVIENRQRREYIQSLNDANNGNLRPFVIFVSQTMYETVKSVVEDFKQAKNET